jgi:hypothetical protein
MPTRDSLGADEADNSPEILRQSRRDRWAQPLAMIVTLVHFLAGMAVVGWYYFVVPRWKQELEAFGSELTPAGILLIGQSDTLVNYWYLLLFVVPPLLAVDCRLTRWVGRQCGLRWGILWGICITVIFLINIGYGQSLLFQERARLIERVAIQGPAVR